jgi:hypothetical protein
MIVRTFTTAAVAIALLFPAVAQAQPGGEVSRADALFHAAKQLRDAGQYVDACPQFAESSKLAPGVGISLYLADCYEHVGRTASAWTEFRKAEQLARARGDKRADLAHARAAALEPKLSGLTIGVAPAVAREPPQVLLDGVPIAPESWNVPMAVDPGDHVVVVNMAGQAPRTLTAHVTAGNRAASVAIDDAPVAAPAPPAIVPAAAPAETPPEDPGLARRWIGIGLLTAGAVGVGLGTIFLLNKDQSNSNAASCNPPPRDNTATPAAIIAYAAGGVAIVAGLALTFSAPSHKGVGVVAAPMFMAEGGGALVRGTFY